MILYLLSQVCFDLHHLKDGRLLYVRKFLLQQKGHLNRIGSIRMQTDPQSGDEQRQDEHSQNHKEGGILSLQNKID
jgi:hypothetical protein